MEPVEWADRMSLSLGQFGSVPRLDYARNFSAWALNVVQLRGIASRNPPDPRGFTDWKSWAERFNQAVILP